MATITVKLSVGNGKYCFHNGRNCDHLAEVSWCRIFNIELMRDKIGATLKYSKCLKSNKKGG